MTEPRCTVPPAGWTCTRTAGHEGPCAALPANPPSAAPLDLDAQIENATFYAQVLRAAVQEDGTLAPWFNVKPLPAVADVLDALVAAARRGVEDTRDANEQTRAAWRAYDITFARHERFARELEVADLLFDYLADWLDWGSLTIQRQREGGEPASADLVVGPNETPRDALLRRALEDGTPEFVAKLTAAHAALPEEDADA